MGAPGPVTNEHLHRDLAALGLPAGGTLLVQASMRAIGWVDGGAYALLTALRDTVGPLGSIAAPTQTTDNSTTSREFRAAVAGLDAPARQAMEDRITGFDPATSVSYRMGRFAEAVRTSGDAFRSAHPQTSFAAVGPAARWLTAVHDLESHLGWRSPLGRLYATDATIVLIGLPFASCVGIHLAEYRLDPPPPTRPYRCFVLRDGVRTQVDFVALDHDDSDFGRLGDALQATGSVRTGTVGTATTRVVSLKRAVDFAAGWMATHRRPRAGGPPAHRPPTLST
jgi:aminoglycoside 3-N-acetyltransferase